MKHFIFDLDGTITESRQEMKPETFKALCSLECETVSVISGASKEQMKKQLGKFQPKFILAQSGNDTKFWKNELSKEEKGEIFQHIKSIDTLYPEYFLKDRSDLLQDRGSQLAFSFIGHNANIEDKKGFDTQGTFRRTVLDTVPFNSNSLEVRVAGTTCLDYTKKDGTKGKNIEKLIKELNWNKEDCIYFGDALEPGQNDETVIGVIQTVKVKNPEDLIEKLIPYQVK
jgi:hypothetical protein